MKKYATIGLLLLTGCANLFPPRPMQLISPAFENGKAIPSQYTCDGENISPPLLWSEPPGITKSFVLIIDDPDAIPVAGHIWDHWVLFNIQPSARSIEAGQTDGIEGITSFGQQKYGGPCPPNGLHTYRFNLYALDVELPLSSGATKQEVETAMQHHILAEARLTGVYGRAK